MLLGQVLLPIVPKMLIRVNWSRPSMKSLVVSSLLKDAFLTSRNLNLGLTKRWKKRGIFTASQATLFIPFQIVRWKYLPALLKG